MSANTKLSNKEILAGWLNQDHFDGHFYVERMVSLGQTLENYVMVCCRCPSMPKPKNFAGLYSGIAFFWVQDADILARPLTFYLDSLPPRKLTHLSDPNCFALMEERLNLLHGFFKQNRKAGM